MYDAMYTQDHCETTDLSQNSLAGGEENLSSRITGLPYATIEVFRIHPNTTHGAAREDFQNGIMPLVTMYQCDAITGDASKSANTYSRLQWVYNPAFGLLSHIMQTYQGTWNTTRGMPIEERMEYGCVLHGEGDRASPSLHEDWFWM